MAPHLHQQGAGGELLVIAAAAQGDGPGQAHVVGDELPLEADSQGQVVGPARVAGPAAVGAHHQHHLGRLFFVLLGDQLIDGPVRPHQGVPVHVQNDFDGGIFGQPVLHRRLGPVIGPVIRRVVVQVGVVDHLEPVGAEDLRHLFPHPDHVVGAVGGAEGVALLVQVPVVLGVGLAAVAVENQDLGVLPQGEAHRPGGQHRGVQLFPGAVVEVHPVLAQVVAPLLSHAGGLHHVVGLRRGLELHLGLVVVVLRVQVGDGLRGGGLLLRLPPLGHRLGPRGQEGGLLHQQPAPAVQPRQGGLHRGLAQLPGHQRHHRLGVGGPPLEGRPGPRQVGGEAHPPRRRQGQPQPYPSPQRTERVSPAPLVPHAVSPLSCVGPSSYCMRQRGRLEVG